ncbi:hypothetical protein A5881_000001 [Enterococcus termitis]
MELVYKKNQLQTSIFYGETFASQIKSAAFEDRHLFLITNQRYYDLFSEKLIQLLMTNKN